MELKQFCPRCGKETDNLYGEEKKLCSDCFPEKNNLLDIPDEIDITLCSVCGRMRFKGEWVEEYTLEDQLGLELSQFSREDVEMEVQFWEEDKITRARVHAIKNDVNDSYDLEIGFENKQCEECSKFHGGFYKVKMQLRGENLDRTVERIADRAAEMTNENRKNFLSNIESMENGFDIYISTESMAKEILDMMRSRYDPDIKRSYELIGEEDGQEVYRNVISVRI